VAPAGVDASVERVVILLLINVVDLALAITSLERYPNRVGRTFGRSFESRVVIHGQTVAGEDLRLVAKPANGGHPFFRLEERLERHCFQLQRFKIDTRARLASKKAEGAIANGERKPENRRDRRSCASRLQQPVVRKQTPRRLTTVGRHRRAARTAPPTIHTSSAAQLRLPRLSTPRLRSLDHPSRSAQVPDRPASGGIVEHWPSLTRDLCGRWTQKRGDVALGAEGDSGGGAALRLSAWQWLANCLASEWLLKVCSLRVSQGWKCKEGHRGKERKDPAKAPDGGEQARSRTPARRSHYNELAAQARYSTAGRGSSRVGARFSCLGIHTLTDGLLTTSRIELPRLGNGGCAAGSAPTEVWGP
jgi:hypothetical protein